MPYKEKEIEKLYYTIGEVAQMFQVNTSHIRFWSKEFDVIRPATNKKGNRLFTQSDIENFRKIYHLVKEKGFTLKGAKVELKEMKVRTKADLSDQPAEAFFPITLEDNPVEIPLAFGNKNAEPDEFFVDKIAFRNSLEKMKSSLLDMHKELTLIEED